jgi:hypothetical protein
VLTLINLLNYVDRYIGSATKQYYQGDLHLSDTETAIPLTAFVFVYMLCSPVFSWLADLGYKRSRIIAAGVLIWSIATAAGALAVDFWTLLISRSLVGVGEAAYATIAPALLSDYYPASRRNAVLSFFYLAIPVGAAVGYALGGEVGKYLGWRYAFLISGAPGLLVAALCLLIDEPVLGAADDLPETEVDGEADEAAAERHPRSASVSRSRSVSSSNRASSYSRSQHLHPDSDGELAEGEAAIAPVEGGAVGVGYTPPRDRSRSNTATNPSNILVRSRAPTSADEAGQPQQGGSLRPGHLVAPPWKESIISLLNNPTYLYATGGMTFVIFASGGLADWMPSW